MGLSDLITQLPELIGQAVEANQWLGYTAIFAAMFLENLFPPIPSELIMPLGGFYVQQGQLDLVPVVLAGSLGTVLTGTLAERDLQPDNLELRLWCDSDLAGDWFSSRSTAGVWLELASVSSGNSFPLAWFSRKGEGTSHSTPEAEFVSLALGARQELLPVSTLLNEVLGESLNIMPVILEDNEATEIIARKGYSPALRHLTRTQLPVSYTQLTLPTNREV